MAKNFYSNDDNNEYQKMVALCVAAASLVVLAFLAMLYVKSEKKSASAKKLAQTQEVVAEQEEFIDSSHNFTSDELDFWDQAEPVSKIDEEDEDKTTPYKSKEEIDKEIKEKIAEKEKDEVEEVDEETDTGEGSLNKEAEEVSNLDDDNHIEIVGENGSSKYYEILSSVDKNDYDFSTNLVRRSNELVYSDSKRNSLKGIDLSKYNGTVDWKAVKDEGVDFAMLRLGSRGYSSGTIELDEKFVEYAQNAQLNGISIGAYFYSQAITEIEAIEEANYVVGAIGSFNTKYPIAIDVENVSGDDARTDKLTVRERTSLVKAFCDTVKTYGYKPIIYANRDMLIAGLNIEDLTEYDVWLSDVNVPTDYPYQFSMWQYTKNGRINGVSGDVDLNISFVDYDKR